MKPKKETRNIDSRLFTVKYKRQQTEKGKRKGKERRLFNLAIIFYQLFLLFAKEKSKKRQKKQGAF